VIALAVRCATALTQHELPSGHGIGWLVMSALGQKQTCAPQKVMSALALIATSNVTYGMSA